MKNIFDRHDDEELDHRTDALLESDMGVNPEIVAGDRNDIAIIPPSLDDPKNQIPEVNPADMATLDIAFELAHLLRGYQPISNQGKIDKRLKSLDMMREYYEKRIDQCTEEEKGLKIVFQHYLNAIKLSHANIVQLQKLVKTIKPYVDELNQRRIENGN